jgi:hypothetical protein
LRALGLGGLVAGLAGGSGHGFQFAVGGAQCATVIDEFRVLTGDLWIFCTY